MNKTAAIQNWFEFCHFRIAVVRGRRSSLNWPHRIAVYIGYSGTYIIDCKSGDKKIENAK